MDNRKAFVFAIIAIFFSFIALGVSDSITSTGNNTTGITNHANLTNLDYASANHTGFTSQSVIPSCAHISGYTATINKLSNTSFECAYIVVPDYTEFAFLTDIDNLNDIKVNKTGDTMTGNLTLQNSHLLLVSSPTSKYVDMNVFSLGSGGTAMGYDIYPSIDTGGAEVRMFRNTNSTGSNGFLIYKGDGSSLINNRFSGNSNSYFNANNGNVTIGASTNTAGYTLDVNGKLLIRNNLTVSNNANSCIQMKDNTGTSYTITLLAGVLTITAGAC